MKIFIGTAGLPLISKGKTTEDAIRDVANLGFNALEIQFSHGIYLNKRSAEKIGDIAKELKINLSIHCPYWINLASSSKTIIKESKKRIIDTLERAEAMQAEIIAVHAGYYGTNKEFARKMVFEACEEINNLIEKNDWTVQLGIESSGKQGQYGTLEEIIELSKKLKNVKPYVDFAHVWARNAGRINYKEILDILEPLKLERLHCHFSGIEYSVVGIGRGNERFHKSLREAKGPNFEDLAREILRRRMNITIVCESPLLEKDALLMKQIFEGLGFTFE